LRAALLALAIGLIAPASAVAQAPHVVASANGGTARSSADEGEILSCDASGCTAAITAPARPPARWDGELPANNGTVVELTFSRPLQLLGASVVDRDLSGGGAAAVERIDDQHFRVTLKSSVPDRAALELREMWTGEDAGKRFTVNRTDYVGLVLPAALRRAIQRRRGGGPVVDLEARSSGLVDMRLTLAKKTLGRRSVNLAAPRRLPLSLKLSRGARRLLADRRRIVPTLTLTFRAPSGDPLKFEQRVALRAKPR
jgi:hypothetical protein